MTLSVRVDDATAAQLRAFAQVAHGLDVPARANRDRILAIISAAGVEIGEAIEIPEGALVGEEAAAPAAVKARAAALEPDAFGAQMAMPDDIAKAPRISVMIAKQKGGIDPVPVGVNGYVISIRRGQRVSIPLPHFEVLQAHAVELEYPIDDSGNIIADPVEVPRFPVQAFGVPA